MNKPSAAESAAAAVKISTLLADLQKQLFSQRVPAGAVPLTPGLLGAAAQPAINPNFGQMDPRASTHAEIRAIPAVQWLSRQAAFTGDNGLRKTYEKKAASSPSSKFADPDAIYRLISCTLSSLSLVWWYQEKRLQPLEMSTEDWSEATNALKVLIRLKRAKGLDVSQIFFGKDLLRSLPIGWEKDALDRLDIASRSARNPYANGKVAERKALKAFTLGLHHQFGEAPTLIVSAFGDLIGHPTSSIKRNIPIWIEEAASVPAF